MVTETSDKNEVLSAIGEAIAQLTGLLSKLDEKKINTIPYKDSWTAGQLSRHVTKSINGMSKVMHKEFKPATRDASEKIAGLKKAFLDFSSKMKSPDFIVPEEGPYEKQAAIDEVWATFEHFKENTIDANLTEMTENLPLGEITKLEMLHFVLYHTQRHLHQLQKIYDALKDK